jgi:uncharacterized protein
VPNVAFSRGTSWRGLCSAHTVTDRTVGYNAWIRLRSLLTQAYIQLYSTLVRFSWDAHKSARNLKERGFDFEFATLVFEGPTLEREDVRRDYGERRVVAIGIAQGIALTVVYTDRTEASDVLRRIISARVSDRHERQAYFEATSHS